MKMKVLNFGSLNLDYIYHVTHFVRAGETLSSSGMNVFCGGKGYNQSLAVCKSGCSIWHAGAVGENDAHMLLETLKESGVNTKWILQKEGSSGHAIIQRETNGQNCILLFGGANQKITKGDVDEVLSYFEAGDYLMAQNEISEMAYLLERAHEKGMRIVFNPSPMDEKVKTYPLEVVDYFILNEIEAGEICELEEGKDAYQLAEKLKKQFPKAKIVLTLGEKGAIYKDEAQTLFEKAYKVQAVDTTGAGDTFTGFFIGSLIQGESTEKALKLATKAAAIAVTRPGAGPSIPTREEVENTML